VTSRPHPRIVQLCKRADTIHLHTLERSDVQKDIRLYLNAELNVLSGDPTGILEQVATKADGLFVYAATAVRLAKT
jgi:hypothetical protein